MGVGFSDKFSISSRLNDIGVSSITSGGGEVKQEGNFKEKNIEQPRSQIDFCYFLEKK